MRGAFSWAAEYTYKLDENKLTDYSLEQQASILADYWLLLVYGVDKWSYYQRTGRMGKYRGVDNIRDVPSLYQKIVTGKERGGMRKYIILAVVFLLTGCPGPGDRMVSREATTAIIKDKQVCIVSPLKPQDQITAIQINSNKSDAVHKVFDDNPAYVAKGECLPLFGFTFRPGERYSIAYDVKSGEVDSHLVTAEFSTAFDDAGAIRHNADTNR